MQKKKESDVITNAKPHTIKKFELIERYVKEWALKILGYNKSKGIIYIDCMSNSGIYKDNNDNLVEGTAMRVARCLNEIITKYPGKDAILIFNDIAENRIQYLKTKINEAQLVNIQVSYYNKDCKTFLRALNLDKFKEDYNSLLLYDPYKASIDWDSLTPFLNCWGEIIINHMVSDTQRGVAQAKKNDTIEKYQETYQKDINSIINIRKNKDELDKVVLEIIKKRKDKSRSNIYIASFPFYSKTNGLIYKLIHCCYNVKGIRLFKKVAWKTFGDKSSLKNTHGKENQIELNFENPNILKNSTDENCYYVKDIAQYIYKQYSARTVVSLNEIYQDLDVHPIFPSDGYKNDIKKELKQLGVVFKKNGNVEFPNSS